MKTMRDLEPRYDIEAIDDAWIREAWERGISVDIPQGNELFLDIDTEADYGNLPERMVAVREKTGVELQISRSRYSQSGAPHRHITMRANIKLSRELRVFLQMYLGSDRDRELRSMRDIMLGSKYPTVFIEGPWKVSKLPYPGTKAEIEDTSDLHTY